MLVVAQGTAGAGKSTVLQRLAGELGGSYIPELLSPVETLDSDAAFLENDRRKFRAVGRTGIHLMDRDFTSTIAFVQARDGCRSEQARRVSWHVSKALHSGALCAPDVFLRFNVPYGLSVVRQNHDNGSLWQDEQFVRKFETFLDHTIDEYISPQVVHQVDGRATIGVVTEACRILITGDHI